jgi:hypothetical protein
VDFVFVGFQGFVVGEVSTGKPGVDEPLCARSMNAQPESEQLQNFHQRLDHWVSKQGFWVQLRFSLAGGGGKGSLSFHLMQLAARVLLFLFISVGAALLFFVMRDDSELFQKEVKRSFKEKLVGEEIEITGLSSQRGEFAIKRLAMTGKQGAIFTEMQLNNISCEHSVFSNFKKVWDPGVVFISRADLALRAGADSPEAAESMSNVYFQKSDNLKLEKIVVNHASIRWGYSEGTRGAILGSNMTADRQPEGWRLRFKGGTFSQNWLKGLNIEEMIVQLGRKGVVIEKATFKKNEGYVRLLGVQLKASERPEISGKISLEKMDLLSFLPVFASDYLEGTISAELKVFGSTNSTEGIGLEGDLVLKDDDFISVRDRVHVLRAINVTDSFNSLNKSIELREGGFHIKTYAGKLEITGANLTAGDLFRMKGDLTVRPPTKEESVSFNVSTDTEDQASEQASGKQGEKSLFEKLEMNLEERDLDGLKASQRLRTMIYEGEMEISLPKESFEKAPKLEEIYSLRDPDGRILMAVPLEGRLDELTLKQAEKIYENGAR